VKGNLHGISPLGATWHSQNDLAAQAHRKERTSQMRHQTTHLFQVWAIDAINTNASPTTGHAAITQRFQLSFNLWFLPVERKHQASQPIHR